jgi:hypothetical protein
MFLFSDAVFVIVITLMAIEIKLPETPDDSTYFSLESLKMLVTNVFAYCVSFVFNGIIWYQHLTIFALLKDYDKVLVMRNLLLLFFIGLFPFCASAIAKASGSMLPFFMYMCIILFFISAQYVLHH